MNSLIESFCQRHRYLQSLFLFKKLLRVSKPEISTFPLILKSCSSLLSLDAGLLNHAYLLKCGFSGCCDVGNSLILMYMKFRKSRDAYQVFDEMPMRNNGDVFNSMIHGLINNRMYEDVVIAFEKMVELCVIPNVDSLCHAIRASSDLNSIEKGQFVHDYVKENGFDEHIHVMNSMISMYVKMGRMDLAQQVFDNMMYKDIVSWNSLITGHAQNGNFARVFGLFIYLQTSENLVPNVVTFLALLSSIGQAMQVSFGMSIHGHLIHMGLYFDVQLGTAMVDMYAKCERLDYAQIVFEQDLIQKTLVSWNTLISRYKQKGYDQEAADLYERMVVEPDIKPDPFSFANVLPAYASLGNLQRIKSIHSIIIKRALDVNGDVVLSTAMLDAYGKCADVNAAELLFDCIQQPNTATWNAMIAVYNLNNQIENGMIIFLEMVRDNVFLDRITIVMVFQSCGQMGSLKQGNMIHGFTLSKGFSSHIIIGNALLDMYMKCGCTKSAETLFSSMSMDNNHNIVTWNTMIYGYMKAGCVSKGIKLFHQMQYNPDSVTIISLLHGSAAVSSSYIELFHAYILKLGLASETLVMNMLIDAYAKIGVIENARALFMQNDFKRDQTSWNIMIAGYGLNGLGHESCKLFVQMEKNGYAPDAITFTSLLLSCSHCGLIEEGCRFFDVMVNKYRIKPSVEHWTSVIDMLGRAGGLDQAYDVIRTGVYRKSGDSVAVDGGVVWGALLSSCRTSMNMEIGVLAGQKLLEMESGDCGYYSLLSNLYSLSKRWDEATKIRRVFGVGKVVKKPGLSILKS